MKKRVILPPAPGFALKIIMGEFGSFLLTGQKVVPEKIVKSGYTFQFDDYEKACLDLLKE